MEDARLAGFPSLSKRGVALTPALPYTGPAKSPMPMSAHVRESEYAGVAPAPACPTSLKRSNTMGYMMSGVAYVDVNENTGATPTPEAAEHLTPLEAAALAGDD
jgi:hypothetical protein